MLIWYPSEILFGVICGNHGHMCECANYLWTTKQEKLFPRLKIFFCNTKYVFLFFLDGSFTFAFIEQRFMLYFIRSCCHCCLLVSLVLLLWLCSALGSGILFTCVHYVFLISFGCLPAAATAKRAVLVGWLSVCSCIFFLLLFETPHI